MSVDGCLFLKSQTLFLKVQFERVKTNYRIEKNLLALKVLLTAIPRPSTRNSKTAKKIKYIATTFNPPDSILKFGLKNDSQTNGLAKKFFFQKFIYFEITKSFEVDKKHTPKEIYLFRLNFLANRFRGLKKRAQKN